MTGSQWIICLLIVTGWAALTLWQRKRTKRTAAEYMKPEEFQRHKDRAAVFIYPLVGLAVIAMMAFNWPRVPQGNGPIVAAIVGFGVALILLGFYKWSKLKS